MRHKASDKCIKCCRSVACNNNVVNVDEQINNNAICLKSEQGGVGYGIGGVGYDIVKSSFK